MGSLNVLNSICGNCIVWCLMKVVHCVIWHDILSINPLTTSLICLIKLQFLLNKRSFHIGDPNASPEFGLIPHWHRGGRSREWSRTPPPSNLDFASPLFVLATILKHHRNLTNRMSLVYSTRNAVDKVSPSPSHSQFLSSWLVLICWSWPGLALTARFYSGFLPVTTTSHLNLNKLKYLSFIWGCSVLVGSCVVIGSSIKVIHFCKFTSNLSFYFLTVSLAWL